MKKNLCSMVLMVLAVAACGQQNESPPPKDVPAAAGVAAPATPLKWEVKGSTSDYDDEALAKIGHFAEMQPADLDAPQVKILFTDPAGAEKFSELKGITFQRVDKGQMLGAMKATWKSASDFILVAQEIVDANYTYYSGTGALVDNTKTRHPVLALMVPIGDRTAPHSFALVIANLDQYAPKQPVAVAVSDDGIDGVQGGVIHGPG